MVRIYVNLTCLGCPCLPETYTVCEANVFQSVSNQLGGVASQAVAAT